MFFNYLNNNSQFFVFNLEPTTSPNRGNAARARKFADEGQLSRAMAAMENTGLAKHASATEVRNLHPEGTPMTDEDWENALQQQHRDRSLAKVDVPVFGVEVPFVADVKKGVYISTGTRCSLSAMYNI